LKHLPKGKILTLPNSLSLLRVPLLVLVVFTLSAKNNNATLLITALIVLTDALDGFIARLTNQVSDLGRIFDHVIDKLVIITLTGTMIATHGLPFWTLPLLLLREGVTLIVAFQIYRTHQIMGQSSKLGRVTGWCMGLTFLSYLYGWEHRFLVLLATLGVATIASLNYLKIYMPYIPGFKLLTTFFSNTRILKKN